MSSTCLELEGSSSGRRLYIQLRYGTLYAHHYKQSCRYKSVYDTHTCTYKIAYSDAYKTKYAMPAYTTVILKMNPRVGNMQKISKFKN